MIGHSEPTTYHRIMAEPGRKETFEEGYREFLLSELRIALEQGDYPSASELVATLAEKSEICQQTARTSDEISLKNFFDILNLTGCRIFLKMKEC
ncbi:MAG: hypothetical protein DRI57_01685 [Deltaproteobacteria bacterium]|nr:MAG: hypothetical protein DRI57_01685 [Deltaproteobacteria bacterium]